MRPKKLLLAGSLLHTEVYLIWMLITYRNRTDTKDRTAVSKQTAVGNALNSCPNPYSCWRVQLRYWNGVRLWTDGTPVWSA